MFFVPAGTLERTLSPGHTVVVSGDEGRHAATVKRMAVSEPILLTDGAGLIASGTVAAVSKHELTVTLETVQEAPRPALRFTLVQALAKGDRDLQAVEFATELGVDEIVPWQAERSIVQWKGERAAKAHKKWVAQAQSATKQSRQARIPQVAQLVTKSALCERIAAADVAVILHEDATEYLATWALPDAGEVLFIVGPEGGISPAEVDAFIAAGARLARLGETVLRSSSAGPAALTALLSRTRWVNPPGADASASAAGNAPDGVAAS